MHRTTIALPGELFQQVKKKAAAEEISVSEVLRRLLTDWVAEKTRRDEKKEPDHAAIEKALSTYGMWGNCDPDDFLQESRARLTRSDQELKDARLDS